MKPKAKELVKWNVRQLIRERKILVCFKKKLGATDRYIQQDNRDLAETGKQI